VGELQAENRNAAGALQEKSIAGLELGVLHHRVPNRHRGAGQSDPAVFLQNGVVREHAVAAAAQGSFVRVRPWNPSPTINVTGFSRDDVLAHLHAIAAARNVEIADFTFTRI